ncbi:melanotransferrin-like [Polyodon spathula]|uniref:melanotransferrin-like n=1 Tax=Polyodon spathula TaxID=7913 RepID=UPI001B7EEB52|nr:melanotransferrin-like [Polyodon spathula]
MKTWTVIFCFLITLQAVLSLSKLRWCITSDLELRKCQDMVTAFRDANIKPALECVEGGSSENCALFISTNQADAVTLDGGFIYEAGKKFNLKPVSGEVYDEVSQGTYLAVAVVRKNNTEINMNNLKGKKSCHTGLSRTVGWNVPVGYLIDSGRMSVMDCNIPQAVSEFFSASCVPGAGVSGYPPSLCQLCIGDENGGTRCAKNSQEERYADYSGAFRCLAEGAGDVAFVKHTTVADNTNGANPAVWAKDLKLNDFQLLCRDGSRAEINSYAGCNLAKVPAHAVVVRPDTNGAEVFSMLQAGQRQFGSDHNIGFKMFDSSVYGGKDLLFKDSTIRLIAIENQSYQDWLGEEYLHALSGLDCSPDRLPEYLRWCTLSHGELLKCSDMATSFSNKNLKPKVQCVSGASPEDCMQLIKKKEADAVTLDGGFIYTAGKTYGLVPAAGESYAYDVQGGTYYAVAVVKRSGPNGFAFSELKGKKSCHTGYQRTAGWNIPIGTLMENGLIRPDNCDFPKATGSFFSASCVPGANQPGFPSSLCELCKGDANGNNKCERSNNELYYGYNGAFRCLAEGGGDVAFVKHTTVFDNTDGKNSESWAAGLHHMDFELLCPNGTRAPVTEYAKCNLALVPAHAVMVHPETNTYAVYGLLSKAQDFFGNDSNPNGFSMFDSSRYQGTDLIFKDSTLHIMGVGEKKTYDEWLGQGYMASLNMLECSAAAVSTTSVVLVTALSFFLTCYGI